MTTEDEDEEEVKEKEGSKVKGEPISPLPLCWRLGDVQRVD